ncbi:MAG: hypothetical protein AB8H80_10645 [Planctomycetota bacterium]
MIALLLPIGIVALLFAAVSAMTSRSRDDQQRQQRLDLMQNALERGDLDVATRRELLAVLRRDHERPSALSFLSSGAWWLQAALGLGWCTFVVCGGAALLSYCHVLRLPFALTLPPTLVGLALMTLPAALGELRRRDRPLASTR